jgi:molybdopterin-dependent oxidoreductase alpha subunit
MAGDHPFDVDSPPAGGWGSVKATVASLLHEHTLLAGSRILGQQNKPEGFACVSCAWAKPAHPHAIEACENGIKATAWEITKKRATSAFFAEHTLAELEAWSDHDLEAQGRLTEPLRWDAKTDRYLPVSWEQAFVDIGRRLNALAPRSVTFYTSGRASLEAAYLYQLFARIYGCNNLPDSSNMCHESTSVALPESFGVPVGTVVLEDFEHTDCIFFFGQNVGTNSPRMMHQLQEARDRGVPVVTFNPLREAGLVSFTNPLSVPQMLTNSSTCISTQYHQVKVGGDIAAITGMCKALFAEDAACVLAGRARIIDAEFIEEHTRGIDSFRAYVENASWEQIEQESGLSRSELEAAATQYAQATRVIGVYGMGLTQHRRGVLAVQMVANFLLLRGNIGKLGAGICPVRGHSNVQGQRSVGITEKPELAPLKELGARYEFTPPTDKGRATVETCEGILDGSVSAFVGLGGNFVRAVPETERIEAAWRRLALTVQVATKLNRSHVMDGLTAYLLPCLGRTEIDRQSGKPQSVTMEDSTGCIHGSRGVAEPAAATLRSEVAIVVGLATTTLPDSPATPWHVWQGDYALIREEIAAVLPAVFQDFNRRMWTPGGFRRPVAAAHRQWNTPSKKAQFMTPRALVEDAEVASMGRDVLRLMTMRSDDQFNTTIYALNDRFRGVVGTRRVLLMNAADIAALGFSPGDEVTASTVVFDGVARSVANLRVMPYNIPKGCVAGYFPECNPLIPLWHHAELSKVPAAKSIPIRLSRSTLRSQRV